MLFKELFKGKGLGRCLVNEEIAKENIELSGKVLDLGSNKPSSYLRFFKFQNPQFLRLDKAEGADFNIDFEKDRLPFEDSSVNAILVFNLFEHIYNYQALAKEIYRVLKPQGLAIGSAPFLIKIHPDPNDFFRYSGQALERIFKQAGFVDIKIKPIGYGPLTAGYSHQQVFLPNKFILWRFCRFALAMLAVFLDKIILKLKPNLKGQYPLTYFFVLSK